MRNISHNSCRDKTRFFQKLHRLGYNVEKYFGAKQATLDNMEHEYFLLEN